MIAARLARKSNDEGAKAADLKSVQLQLDEMARFAAAKGWTVDDKYTYVDDGVSGADFANRHGLQRLLAALDPKPPFKILMVTEISRIGRRVIRTLATIEDIIHAGVEVWTTSEGGARVNPRDIATIVKTWKSDADRDETIVRVNRALDTRFERNLATGGNVYGYRNVRVEGIDKQVRREVDPEQSKVVAKIFEWCAEGRGATWIAFRLAATGVKSPVRITEIGRARRERRSQARVEAGQEPLKPILERWTADGVREILARELYIGNIVRYKTQRGVGRGDRLIRTRTPDRVKTQHDEALRIISDDLWKRAHAAIDARSARHLRLNGKLVGRPESFRGTHLLSNVVRCAICGAMLHAIRRGSKNRLVYACSANRTLGPTVCPNASAAPAEELHHAVVGALRGTFTAESFKAYLAEKANSQAETDARHAELAHLRDVVLPGLIQREERLLDAVEAGLMDRDTIRKRSMAIRDERGVAEARRDELISWQRNAAADVAQAEELAANWNGWAEQMEREQQVGNGESVLSRQILAKALGGAPVYVMPGTEKRTWHFLGLASYEGVLRGAVRPGAIARFVQDGEGDELVDRGAPPAAVRAFLAHQILFQSGAPLPPELFTKQADGTTTYTQVDEATMARLLMPEWAQSYRRGWAQPNPTKRQGIAKPRPIADGSDAKVQPVQCQGRGAPCHR
jgi:DNA invertase Pin-like site-specific DNA recombinase